MCRFDPGPASARPASARVRPRLRRRSARRGGEALPAACAAPARSRDTPPDLTFWLWHPEQYCFVTADTDTGSAAHVDANDKTQTQRHIPGVQYTAPPGLLLTLEFPENVRP